MRANAGFLIFIGLILLIGAAAAAAPLTVTINSSKTWVVADSGQAAITVNVKNTSYNTDLSGAVVSFSIIDSSYGSISAPSVITDSNGDAIASFTPAPRSGTAKISISTVYNDAGSIFSSTSIFEQKIDHDVLASQSFDNPAQVPVGSVTQMNITLFDRNFNRVDNKNPAESHSVTLTMSGVGGSGIWNGADYAPQLTVPTDAEGNISVKIRVSTVAGPNILSHTIFGPMAVNIEGISDSNPISISQLIPSPTSWPADGTHVFNLYYSVKDKYGNPLDGADIWINSSTSESFFSTTSNGGVAFAQYGPKDVTGTYTITAKPVKNSSVLCTDTGTIGYCSQKVDYYSQDPVDMILTASPQTLVSLDIDATSQSIVQARVVDVSGNPVQNETVTFTMGSESFPSGPYNETTPSRLAQGTPPLTIQTDSNGFANTQFIPGKFSIDRTTGDYNATATGVRTITAKWLNKKTGEIKSLDVTFNWKNYPYLTVTSSVDKTSAKVGDPLRVSIVVSGNGAALQPKPIDVVISMDRSGSMLENNPDRMVTAKSAANTFASCLTYGRDDIGIVSFGDNSATSGWVNLSPTLIQTWNAGYCQNNNKYSNGTCKNLIPGYYSSSWNWHNVYGSWKWVADDSASECGSGCDGSSDSSYDPTSPHQVYLNANYNNGNPKNYGAASYASTDLSFATHSLSDVNSALTGIVPGGGTPTREGLYNAVNLFPAYSSGRVRAIILQTDGDWNTGGDPEGGSGATRFQGPGTGSIITYANQSKIAIYTIGLGVASGSTIETELKRYATNDAGKYYSASDPSQLPGIYTDIAGQLNQQAGGSTKLDLQMGSITINGSVVDSGSYLNYMAIPVGGRKTGAVASTDSTYVNMYHTNKDGSNTNYYTYTRDDTQNWTPSRNLKFDIGTIKLGDTWQTTFQFNLTKNGTLVLFGPTNPGSTISFTDSSTGLTQTSTLDSKTISVYNSVVNQGFGTKSLLVNNLQFVGGSPDANIWTIKWDTTYTGESKAQETVEYLSSEPGSQWTTVPGTVADKSPSVLPLTDTLDIDTSMWKQDVTYTIRVTAVSANNDAPPSSASIGKTKSLALGSPFIKLE